MGKEKLSMECRISMRGLINQKLAEVRAIGIDTEAFIKKLQEGCSHELTVWTDESFTRERGSQGPQIRCLICGLMEDMRDARPNLNRSSAKEISREEFEMLGVIPPLKESPA